MRFATKFDRWLVILLVIAAGVSLGLPLLGGITHSPVTWVAVLPWIIWPIAMAAMLPQYYELRPDGLYIRQGWRKKLIPYPDLVELRPVTDSRSAAVFSMDRVEVSSQHSGRWIIAPAEQERFIEQLAGFAPQLQRKGMGLGLPLSTV